MKTAPSESQQFHRLPLGDPPAIEGLQNLLHKPNRQPLVNSLVHPEKILDQRIPKSNMNLYLIGKKLHKASITRGFYLPLDLYLTGLAGSKGPFSEQ